jgi:hypothetical protein
MYSELKNLNSKRTNNTISKWANELDRRSTNGQQKHEEMFNIPGHQGNANQNDTEISSHPSQNGYHQEFKQQRLERMKGKRNHYTSLLVGMQISAASMESSTEVSQKTKNRTII